MKVGIITFHWATNYGAVLQAYALQEYLNSINTETNIIDYYPKRFKKTLFNAIKTKHFMEIPARIKLLEKEKNISDFRKKYLKTTRYYNTDKKLKKSNFPFDIFLCGSDQIWNESFTLKGERKKTFAYFLDFVPDGKIMASYAASFGVTSYNSDLKDDVRKYLRRFNFISLREETGISIVNDLGILDCTIVPDPTVLLKQSDYMRFVDIKETVRNYVYIYMLHGKKVENKGMSEFLNSNNLIRIEADNESIEEWLTRIYHSNYVITNSFHGTVFSIIFKKPFASVMIDGSGMNDRIVTLLKTLGLENRMISENGDLPDGEIDWNSVNIKLNEFRNEGYRYINKVLNSVEGKGE